MIHYHGLPITPEAVIGQAMAGSHFFASFAHRGQIGAAISMASSFAADNGAFPLWKAGGVQLDWMEYYGWVDIVRRVPAFDFAVIPDVINGTEEDNERLLEEWPFEAGIGAPVWHLNESIERLVLLCQKYQRVCLGSSGQYSEIGTAGWWERMDEAFEAIVDPEGYPISKIHGLRMLNPEVVAAFPFKSCDSTNLARNIGIDSRWNGSYAPPSKAARAAVLRARIEGVHSPDKFQRAKILQTSLFD